IDPSGYISTVAEIDYASALSAAIGKTLTLVAVGVYGAHYASRDYTVYAVAGWRHSFMYVNNSDSDTGKRYDLFAYENLLAAKQSPFSFFDALIEEHDTRLSEVVKYGFLVPVAKFNPTHVKVWESAIQGLAISMLFEPQPFPFPSTYSYYWLNCHI